MSVQYLDAAGKTLYEAGFTYADLVQALAAVAAVCAAHVIIVYRRPLTYE